MVQSLKHYNFTLEWWVNGKMGKENISRTVRDQIFWGSHSCFTRFDCMTDQVHIQVNFIYCCSFLKNTFTFSVMKIKVDTQVITNPYMIYQYMYYNGNFINTSLRINLPSISVPSQMDFHWLGRMYWQLDSPWCIVYYQICWL